VLCEKCCAFPLPRYRDFKYPGGLSQGVCGRSSGQEEFGRAPVFLALDFCDCTRQDFVLEKPPVDVVADCILGSGRGSALVRGAY